MNACYLDTRHPIRGWHLCLGVGWDFTRKIKLSASRTPRHGGGFSGYFGLNCIWIFGWAHK
jgi:hypothetical protein